MTDALTRIIEAYQFEFDSVPPIAGLSPKKLDLAADLLAQAIEDDAPYEDEADWWKALGMPPPDPDALY